MQMVTLYLLRHAATQYVGEKQFVGQTDLPLSQEGRHQADKCRQQLANVAFSEIWCSNLKRTYETAELISRGRQSIFRSVPELREIDLGAWDGVAMTVIRERFPDLWRERGENIARFRPPSGESFADLQQRVIPLIEQIVAHSSGNILVVTHAGVIRVILCHILQAPLSHLFRIQLDYGGLTIIESRNGILQIRSVNLRIGNYTDASGAS